jgi:integrase/recombinase XerD
MHSGFTSLIDEFLTWRITLHLSSDTVVCNRRYLDHFLTWCRKRRIMHPGNVTPDHVQQYIDVIRQHRKKDGDLLHEKTQFKRFQAVQMFYKWLIKNRIILYDPTQYIDFRQGQKSLPKAILTHAEVELIMAQPDLNTTLGIRDRAILETLYSTGIRRSELIKLTMDDLNRSTMTLFINQGKGKKDRVVPVGKRCILWVERYLTDARPELLCYPESDALFLTIEGGPFSGAYLCERVRKYIIKSGITKPGACHLFRHSMATGMLENGADIRFIQEILGHERLTTTQVYTRVSIEHLKKVHKRTHPGR